MSNVFYLPRPLLPPDLRKRVEQTIEHLIGLLDAVETPREDLEPALGAAEFVDYAGCNWLRSRTDADEREEENEHGGDVLEEGEETLGWCENVRQLALGHNTADGDATAPERHGKGFVRSASDDAEPDLGASENHCFGGVRGAGCGQRGWSTGTTDDRELDEAERGIADADGLAEQLGRSQGVTVV